jgi:hypothetical protein
MATDARSREQAPISFRAPLSTIDDATLARLPEDVSERLPSRGQVAAHASIGGRDFETVVEPDGRRGHCDDRICISRGRHEPRKSGRDRRSVQDGRGPAFGELRCGGSIRNDRIEGQTVEDRDQEQRSGVGVVQPGCRQSKLGGVDEVGPPSLGLCFQGWPASGFEEQLVAGTDGSGVLQKGRDHDSGHLRNGRLAAGQRVETKPGQGSLDHPQIPQSGVLQRGRNDLVVGAQVVSG